MTAHGRSTKCRAAAPPQLRSARLPSGREAPCRPVPGQWLVAPHDAHHRHPPPRGLVRHQGTEWNLPVRYECNPKHKRPWQRGRKGTLCPRDIDQAMAQRLLEDSVAVDDKRYGVYEGEKGHRGTLG